MATELLPCPFCGSTSVQTFKRPDGLFSWIYCGPCGAEGPVEAGYPDTSTPEERWNRRAAPAEARSVEVPSAEAEINWKAEWEVTSSLRVRDADHLRSLAEAMTEVADWLDRQRRALLKQPTRTGHEQWLCGEYQERADALRVRIASVEAGNG